MAPFSSTHENKFCKLVVKRLPVQVLRIGHGKDIDSAAHVLVIVRALIPFVISRTEMVNGLDQVTCFRKYPKLALHGKVHKEDLVGRSCESQGACGNGGGIRDHPNKAALIQARLERGSGELRSVDISRALQFLPRIDTECILRSIIHGSDSIVVVHPPLDRLIQEIITKEDKGNIDVQWLDSLPSIEDMNDVRYVRVPFELEVKIDGKLGKAVIQKKINNI